MKNFDRHKKEPRAGQLRGFYRLLPQLVGSFDPGGGWVSGDGVPPGSGLLFEILAAQHSGAISRHDYS